MASVITFNTSSSTAADFDKLSCPKCGGSKPTCCTCTDDFDRKYGPAIEHERLRLAVVEAAKAWRRDGVVYDAEFHFRIDPLLQAIDALNEFESKCTEEGV